MTDLIDILSLLFVIVCFVIIIVVSACISVCCNIEQPRTPNFDSV